MKNKKVKCLNNLNNNLPLTIGKVYNVIGYEEWSYVVINDDGYSSAYNMIWFEEIKDEDFYICKVKKYPYEEITLITKQQYDKIKGLKSLGLFGYYTYGDKEKWEDIFLDDIIDNITYKPISKEVYDVLKSIIKCGIPHCIQYFLDKDACLYLYDLFKLD